jgi:DNA polymerase III delta subunit
MKSPQNVCGADVTIEVKRLRSNDMAAWIGAEFARHGKSIPPSAVALLQTMKSDSMREIAGEIEKIHLAFPDSAAVTEDDIFTMLGVSKQYSVFQLADAVLARDLPKAMEILPVLMSSASPTLIVFQLARQVTLLWQLASLPPSRGRSSDDAARAIGFGFGWQMDEMKKFQGNFRFPSEHEKLFEYLLAADVELKSRPTDPAVVLSRLLYEMTNPS